VKLPEPDESPTRLLSPIERATIKITAPELREIPPGNSILHEAVTRLAVYQMRHVLPYASGHYIAAALQRLAWPAHPGKHARRGWTLLAAIDAADLGAEIWISGEPLQLWGDFRRMRLHERLDELSRVGVSPCRSSPERRRTEIR
jgi:hypothetical protein